jgi:hypothetical protein
MPPIIRAIALLAVIGFVVGMFGALFSSGAWLRVGGLLFVLGSLIVWAYTLRKRSQAMDIVSLDPPPEEEPPVDTATADKELRRKDRGSEARPGQ